MRCCIVCNNSIEHRIKSAKFCSDQCKNNSWKANNWDNVLKAAKKYRETHKKSELSKQQTIEWRRKNRDKVRFTEKLYHRAKRQDPLYLAKRRHYEALRRARKLQATPKWLTKEQLEEIKLIYRNCPEGHHVDHIMPLRGKESCGLHVPWNLQYLPGIVNKMKSNKVNHGNTN